MRVINRYKIIEIHKPVNGFVQYHLNTDVWL